LVTVAGWGISAAGLNRALFGDTPWNFAFHAVFLLVPLSWMVLKPSRLKSYGIRGGDWPEDLKTGIVVFVLLFLPPLLADLLTGNVQLTSNAARSGLLSTAIFFLVFVGVGEELLYRGFFQGEFNRIWGRPFQFGRTSFGPGLILASLLFGVGHLLNPFNPLRARFGLDWVFFFVSLFVGLLFGLVRERLNGLIAVSLIHLGLVLYVRSFVVTPFSGTALIVVWTIGLVFLVRISLGKSTTQASETVEMAP
jgi:membrane protease YdiL (CAAX protease family)